MLLLSIMVLALMLYTTPVWANPACAVCTVGVVVGLEIARNLGVDDGVIAIWAGALLALIGYWTILWFEKKGWSFRFRNELIMVVSLSMILGVYIKDLTYTPKPILFFYMDPFLFCAILGALILIYSSVFYQWMKARNGGHAHFPFEKVVLPILALAIASYAVNYWQLCRPQTVAENTVGAEVFPADGSDIYDFGE